MNHPASRFFGEVSAKPKPTAYRLVPERLKTIEDVANVLGLISTFVPDQADPIRREYFGRVKHLFEEEVAHEPPFGPSTCLPEETTDETDITR